MQESIVRITTEDTKKVYEFPSKDAPQLWLAEIRISAFDSRGHANRLTATSAQIHLERSTLENARLIPMCPARQAKNEQPIETAADLLLRLLEHVGVYPEE